MASNLYKTLVRFEFSERFLKTSAGNHPVVRQAILATPDCWRRCENCRKYYADVAALMERLENSSGRDLRVLSTKAHKTGFCSYDCAEDKFDCGENTAYKRLNARILASSPNFYKSKEWQEVRYVILQRDGAACACCGRTRKHGVVLHVDHILSRFLRPELALDEANLQVLCEDCNKGKGWRHSEDWRN